MSADTIARLKITLDDVRPAVLRRIEVPFDIRLDRLHLAIQAAMGWTNTHLYEIRARDVGWSTPDADADWGNDFLDARKARLGDVLEDLGTKTLKYLYDFGDGWEHTIKIERLTDPEPGIVYPRLTEVSGRCPPEDCGGPWGYAELIEAIKDPKHERHDELTEWIGDDFDPHADQAEWLTAKSMPSPRNGPASPQANSRDAPNPRPSPEGYVCTGERCYSRHNSAVCV
jgi:Plasmid pRiA4b ORF-3-like protein